MKAPSLAVTTTSIELRQNAEQLAEKLGLAFLMDASDGEASHYDYLLILTPDYLGLHKTSDHKLAPFYIDFLAGKMRYRSKQAGLRKELLARALGMKPREHPIIIDATAGLGRDSFILATLGFEVTMLERSPILHALLEDALIRAAQDKALIPVIKRMHLLHTDAIAWLTTLSSTQQPDIIYLDPMFPSRQKSASVKKEMVFMQELLGKDMDSDNLFLAALTCARKRVVVKRPKLAANIAQRAPNFVMTGKSSRFDVYLI